MFSDPVPFVNIQPSFVIVFFTLIFKVFQRPLNNCGTKVVLIQHYLVAFKILSIIVFYNKIKNVKWQLMGDLHKH